MSANIDSMMYVGETPWHGLGVKYVDPPETAQDIIKAAKLDWTVDAAKMKTDLLGDIPNYHAIYRTDTNQVLGVVNSAYPSIIQNVDTFNAVGSLLNNALDVETAASLGRGETVFGCFKIRQEYKILDDDIVHYFVIMNDHLKVDGRVTVLNTPIRVVCQNTLSAALNNNVYKLRVPITHEVDINSEIANKLISGAGNAIVGLQAAAEKMVKMKLDKKGMEDIMDRLFPYVTTADDINEYNKANERIEQTREIFISDCLAADNLGNYRGTHYQVFNALTDFTQHYFKKPEKAYDLNYRMKLLPGMSSDGPSNLVTKYLKIMREAA